MDSEKISALIQQGISEGVFPGAVAIVVAGGRICYCKAFGYRMISPAVKVMQSNTLFDLASLTKPVVAATLIMRLVEEGSLELDAPVQTYLPGFSYEQVTLLHLLTHTSGLPAWRPVYLEAKSKSEVLDYLGGMSFEYPTGQRVVYSCLGYILLGLLIAQVGGKSLEDLAQERIFSPLEMSNTRYCPSPRSRCVCAATEDSNSFERHMVNNEPYDWRKGVIVGEVHDVNAHFLGGVSGNSGLFSTAQDIAKFCQMLVNGGDVVLTPASVERLSIVETTGLDATRGIGWAILDDGSLYHTGFTGTSIRLNLTRSMFAVLLTNRVHPEVRSDGMRDFRNKFHRLIFVA